MTREPPPIRVELEVGRSGIGTLRVGGVDIGPAVRRAGLYIEAGELPLVFLDLVPGGSTAVVEGRLVVDDPDELDALIAELELARTDAYRLRATAALERIHERDRRA